MTAAVLITITAASFAGAGFAQERPQPPPPPATPLGQSAPTSTVPSAGVTINAATGLPVTSPTEEQLAAGTSTGLTNAIGSGALTNTAGVASGLTNAASPAARAGTNSATASQSNITPVQLQNINRLAAELNRLALPSRDAAGQQRRLIENLSAAPIAPVRPAPQSISKLGVALVAVIPSLNLTAFQRRQLAIDLNLALNSGKLTPLEAERVMTDARTLLRRNAVQNPEGVQQLLVTLGEIVSDVQATLAQAARPAADAAAAPQANPQPAEPAAPVQTGQGGRSQAGEGSGSYVPPEG